MQLQSFQLHIACTFLIAFNISDPYINLNHNTAGQNQRCAFQAARNIQLHMYI